MIFRPFFDFEHGCAAYLFGCGGKGLCAVVDARESEVDDYAAFAASKGNAHHPCASTRTSTRTTGREGRRWPSASALSTACIAPPTCGGRSSPLDDGQEIELGNTRVRVLHTPGHTPESMSLVVTDLRRGPAPWFVLTGDTLFSGAVGRPDLPGRRARERLALVCEPAREAPHAAGRPRGVPAHFGGSACGAGLSGKPSSTIGFEKRWNRALSLGREEFVDTIADVADQAGRHPRRYSSSIAATRRHDASSGGLAAARPREQLAPVLAAGAGQRVRRRDGGARAQHPAGLAEQEFHLAAGLPSSRSSSSSASSRRSPTTSPGGSRDSRRPQARARRRAGSSRSRFLSSSCGRPRWSWVLFANVLLGVKPGPHLVDDGHHEDRPGRARAPRARDGAQRVRRLPRRRAVARSRPATSRPRTGCGPSRSISGSPSPRSGSLLSALARPRDARPRRSTRRSCAASAPRGRLSQREVFLRTSFADREPVERQPGRPGEQPERRHGVGPLPALLRRRRAVRSSRSAGWPPSTRLSGASASSSRARCRIGSAASGSSRPACGSRRSASR